KYTMSQAWCNVCDGRFTSTAPPPANLEQLLPVWDDASTWNWTAMSPLFRDYQVAIGNMSYAVHRQIYAAWFQDDWKISNKLTANMGVRYDLDHGAQGEFVKFLPWLSGRRPTDKNNIAPRLGFAYRLNDKSVIRAGWGLFFTALEDDALHQPYIADMVIDSNFVFTGGRKEERRQNINSMIHPATGANYAFTDVAHNPFPTWGPLAAEVMNGRSNYYGWENTFTKRFSNRWQA